MDQVHAKPASQSKPLMARYHLWRSQQYQARHNPDAAGAHLVAAARYLDGPARDEVVNAYQALREASRPLQILIPEGPCHIVAIPVPADLFAPYAWQRAFELANQRGTVAVETVSYVARITAKGRVTWNGRHTPVELLMEPPSEPKAPVPAEYGVV